LEERYGRGRAGVHHKSEHPDDVHLPGGGDGAARWVPREKDHDSHYEPPMGMATLVGVLILVGIWIWGV